MLPFVITLISAPHYPLPDAILSSLTTALAGQPHELLKHRAYDIGFQGMTIQAAKETAQRIVGDLPIDTIVQPASGRRKKLLISDMDSTMIEQECIDELADCVGMKPHIAAITERAMNGELDFKAALRERVGLLGGLAEEALQSTYETRITLMPGAKKLIATMKRHGAYTVLVSGGFTFFTGRVRDAIGFDADDANRLEIVDGKLTGKVIEPILDKESKLASLHHYAKLKQLSTEEVLAIGDGANDLPMLLAAGLGVAYHAKPTVRAQANAALNHNDLSALLYVQGYTDGEINN